MDAVTGIITTVAGTGEAGFSGDGGPATAARIRCPDSIDIDESGNLWIADRCNQRIRRVDGRTGIITTVAGTGVSEASPDGVALAASLQGPYYVRAESPMELTFTDTDSHRIRRIDLATGRIETLAGSGEGGFSGDGGPALEAAFSRPHVALRAHNGDLIIGDSFNQRIRRVDQRTGIIRTIAGNGAQGVSADGTPALEAPLAYFGQIHELPDGDLIFTEWANGRVLRLDTSAYRVFVLAGTTDPAAPEEDGHPPLATRLGSLAGMEIDERGRILVMAAESGLLRRIDLEAGTVETIAGNVIPR